MKKFNIEKVKENVFIVYTDSPFGMGLISVLKTFTGNTAEKRAKNYLEKLLK